MRDPANSPVKLRQMMSHHIVFDHPCIREPNPHTEQQGIPKQEPNRDSNRKGFLP